MRIEQGIVLYCTH